MNREDSDNLLPLYRRLRDARRVCGLTQSALAAEVGCQQSALSMMERGKVDAVARPTLEKIAATLGVELGAEESPGVDCAGYESGLAICPNGDCPSNVPYLVGDELLLWPRQQPAKAGKYCRWCGEVMSRECRNCKAVISEGACCPQCGAAHLIAPEIEPALVLQWVAERRRQLAELQGLTER